MLDQTELAARHYLYTVFQSLLGTEPTMESLMAVDTALLGQAFDVVELGGVDHLLGVIEDARANEETVAATVSEYTRALVGPGKLPAPPWETIYLSGSDGLFSRLTLEVRNAYRAQGFLPAEYPRVSDDHIALECGFLALLAERALAHSEVDDSSARAALTASASFLESHLLKWVTTFADDLENASCPFYGTVAQALAAFVQFDHKLLTARAV